MGGGALAGVISAVLALGGGSMTASTWPSAWDGTNPYHCKIQNAGFGTKVRDPGADPYCVRFNKTQQNITQLGIVAFLEREPARTAAAVPKCFYFQEDSWRGSVIQSDGQTVLYSFQGHYFFNKATGDGGVWIHNLTIGGHLVGTGGYLSHDDVPVDSKCAAMANQDPAAVYADPGNPET